jgi:hypothetical protein
LAAQAEAALNSGHFSDTQVPINRIRVGKLFVALHEWERGEALLKQALRWEDYFTSRFSPAADSKIPASLRALALGALGRARHGQHDTKRAITYFDLALTAWEECRRDLTRDEHQEKAGLHMFLGAMFLDREKLYRAELEYRQAAETYARLQSPQDRARALNGVADILIRKGQYNRARDLLSPNYTILKSPPHSSLAYTASLYAKALTNVKDDRAAEQVLSETFALHDRGLISLEDAAYFADELSILQLLDGRICEAQAMAHKSKALLARARPDHEWTEKELRPQLTFNGIRCSESIAAQ